MPTSVEVMREALRDIPGVFTNPQSPVIDVGQYGPAEEVWAPDTSDALVPRDMPYGGRALPVHVGGAGSLTDWDTWVRGAVSGDLERALSARGTEALAWYEPFHQEVRPWGIHIPIRSIAFLAGTAFSSLHGTPEERWRAAFLALHQHEFNHFAVEYFTGIWEILHGVPCWAVSAGRLRDPVLGFIREEERLANAHMLREVKRSGRQAGRSTGLRQFVSRQPDGYRHAIGATSDEHFEQMQDDILHARVALTSAYAPPRHRSLELRELVDGFPRLPWTACPIYLYDERAGSGAPPRAIWFIGRIATPIVETRTFQDQLSVQPPEIQRRWPVKKSQLAQTTLLDGLDFKKWAPGGEGVYSVRVSKSHRAHLRFDPQTQGWFAERIGSHAAMGHGK